eukprot:8627207-Alexandrium_andersonii.AAC.1
MVVWRFVTYTVWHAGLTLLSHHEHAKSDAHLAAKRSALFAAVCWTHLVAKGVALKLQCLWHCTTALFESKRKACCRAE